MNEMMEIHNRIKSNQLSINLIIEKEKKKIGNRKRAEGRERVRGKREEKERKLIPNTDTPAHPSQLS